MPKQFLMGCMLHAVDIAKFNEWAAQCTYIALGKVVLMCV